jgi:hypothetical protein
MDRSDDEYHDVANFSVRDVLEDCSRNSSEKQMRLWQICRSQFDGRRAAYLAPCL